MFKTHSKDAQTIHLEKVDQYLKNENLRFHVSDENSWFPQE